MAAVSPRISSIQITVIYSLQETGTTFQTDADLSSKNKSVLSWKSGKLKTCDIEHCRQLTFGVDIALNGIFDVDGKDITHQYETADTSLSANEMTLRMHQMCAKLDAMQSNIEALERKMDERLRNNEKQLKAMRREVEQMAAQRIWSPEQQKVRSWLERQVKLPQYFQLFVDNGLSDMDVARLIDKDALKFFHLNVSCYRNIKS